MSADLVVIQQTLEPKRVEALSILAEIEAFEIQTEEHVALIADATRELATRRAEIEKQRVAITKPMLDAKRKVDAMFAAVLQPLQDAEARLRYKLTQYHAKQEEARAAAMRANAETFQAGGVPTTLVPKPVAAQGISLTSVWAFEITDPDAVPREFCTPDPKLIQAAIPKDGAPPEIPGVRFYRESKIAVRRKK